MAFAAGDHVMVRHAFGGEVCAGRVSGLTTGGVFVVYLSDNLHTEQSFFPDDEVRPLVVKWPAGKKAVGKE